MRQTHVTETAAQAAALAPQAGAVAARQCGVCAGSGGWYRYEPSLEPAPGLLYLSCMQCVGTGRALSPRA